MLRSRPRSVHPSAFTLLEVILALAILAGAVAVLGEVMSLASRNASDAQAEAQAQLLASTVMDEMLSGVTEFENLSSQPLDTDSAIPWIYSVGISTTNLEGLMLVEVLVEQDTEEQFRPVKYQLTRWISTSDEEDAQPTSTEEEG